MRILYLGRSEPASTSRHRALALSRIGHSVTHVDAQSIHRASFSGVLGTLHFKSGYRLIQRTLCDWLESLEFGEGFDVVWVDSGYLFGRENVRKLKQFGERTILYCIDDPAGGRDGHRFDSLRAAIPEYDLCVSVRPPTIADLIRIGAKRTLKVMMSYDEIAHALTSDVEVPESLRSDVAFVGTWMRGEGRDEFILELDAAGVPVSIWGDRWPKSRHWKRLEKCWRGPAISSDTYRSVIRGAKLCLGLLSSGNRDEHTTRSFEIPAIGGLLCAKRTPEHMQLYEDRKQAVFWDDAKECAETCKELLANPARAEDIRRAGVKRVRALKNGNEDVCRRILEAVGND